MKKTNLTTIICSAVLLLCGCGDSVVESENTTTMPTESISSDVESVLPTADLGGADFNILVSDDVLGDFYCEEANGEIVNDAIFDRNQSVSDSLNVNLNYITQPGSWLDKDTFNNHIISSVMAGDGAYDLIIGMTVIVFPIASSGYFEDYLSLESINLENKWWMENLSDNLSIDGNLYGVIGDASLSMYTNMNVMFFNQRFIEEYNLENPYELVRTDRWTIDTLIEQCTDLGRDLNNNSQADIDDFYGFTSIRVPARGFQTSLGIELLQKDNVGKLKLTELSNATIDLIDKIKPFFVNTRDTMWEYLDETDALNMFVSGRSIYLAGYLYNMSSFRDMPDDYGVIPYPKADENYEYYIQTGTTTQAFFIPVTANSPETSALILEYLGYESYTNVIPAYYEVTLKDKYARDENVIEMLDLIRASAKMDFSFAYNVYFSPQLSMFLTDILSPSVENNTISYYEKNKSAWEGQIKSIYNSNS